LSPFSTQETIAVEEEQKQQPIAPEASEELRRQAHQHLQARRWSLAGETFLALLEKYPQDEDAMIGVAMALDAINRYDSLYSAAQNILNLNSNSASGLALKARALQKLERLSEATIANDQALLLDTNLGLAWINRSGLQLLQQKFPEALRSSQRAVELAPNDARAWANQGVALFNFNRLTEALDAFDQSLAIDPDNIFSLHMKCEILSRIGRMHEVIPLVRKILLHEPTHIPALTLAVQALRALEMHSALVELARELTQFTPESIFAWENYMRGLRGTGSFEEALDVFDHLLALDPSNERFLTLKADTLYRLERYREAASVAERALRLNEEYPPAHRIHEKAVRLMYQKKTKKEKKT
jgi:tetratricopeptide (TPR) repeat protein